MTILCVRRTFTAYCPIRDFGEHSYETPKCDTADEAWAVLFEHMTKKHPNHINARDEDVK